MNSDVNIYDICINNAQYSIPRDFFASSGFNCSLDPNNQLRAHNDLQAVAAWLNEFCYEFDTYRSNQKEILNLLLWCYHKQKKTVSDLNKEDFKQYFTFLQNIPPDWIMPKGMQTLGREHPNWRPFLGSLSLSSVQKSISIIKSMLDEWVKSGYIKYNPVMMIKKYTKLEQVDADIVKLMQRERVLSLDEVAAIVTVLQDLPQNFVNIRLILMFSILYLVGLRRSELANLKWGDLILIDKNTAFLIKMGKGSKSRTVYLNQELRDNVFNYRNYLNNKNYPNSDLDFILLSQKTKLGLTTDQIYKQINKLGNQAAQQFSIDSQQYRKLCKLTPHDLRRTSGTHQHSLGVPLEHIQANFGHSKRETTENNYVLAINSERSDSSQLINLNLHINYT